MKDKNNKWCRFWGHKWIPIYIGGYFNKKKTKIISCYCVRCRKGHDEISKFIDAQSENLYNTWSEKYFNNDNDLLNVDLSIKNIGKLGVEFK